MEPVLNEKNMKEICCMYVTRFLSDIDTAQRGHCKGYYHYRPESLDYLVKTFIDDLYVNHVIANPDKFIYEFLRLNQKMIDNGEKIVYTKLYTYLL